MELVLNNDFCEMSQDEMFKMEGGGILKAVSAFTGCVLIGVAPVVGVAAGIGTSAYHKNGEKIL